MRSKTQTQPSATSKRPASAERDLTPIVARNGRRDERLAAPSRARFLGEPVGFEDGSETAVYDRSVAEGSTVVSVRVPRERAETVTNVLDRHDAIDIEERAANYGLSGGSLSPEPDVPQTGENLGGLRAPEADRGLTATRPDPVDVGTIDTDRDDVQTANLWRAIRSRASA